MRAHIILCMLAYYVALHMIEAWRALLFADEDQQAKRHRDPIVPARRSAKAQRKALTHTLDNGSPAHSKCSKRSACSQKQYTRNELKPPTDKRNSLNDHRNFGLIVVPR